MLVQTIYASARQADESGSDLGAILSASRRNNPAIGVTGLLVVLADRYIQALEGPAESIDPLLDFIAMDDRHGGMRVLARLAAPERSFARFAMADVAPEPLQADRIGGCADALVRRPDEAAARSFWHDLARLAVDAPGRAA